MSAIVSRLRTAFGQPRTAGIDRASSLLDRTLSIFSDVRAGEGATALLMLANIFLLLICYSVIKTVREPLILLGGGAEVRSYAAAGQALLLMGFVPLYSWFVSRVERARLLVGVTLFFVVCIEIFAAAVTARVPYVGVAFFIWVGIFNISLVAQFWSFANDIYDRDAGNRLFPVIVIGMTAGAPLGSLVAGRLFALGISPQAILQIAALLLGASAVLYLQINRRASTHHAAAERLPGGGGFGLVLASPYLRLVAILIVLLNVVNTTGEYLVARLLTAHVDQLALATAAFDKQAYIGAFTGDYQFRVNVLALLLQAFLTSRLVKYRGLQGVLLALPLIALGGYTIIAAGVGFSFVRWIKTAENATDYSIMNTARQLLWLPATREEKYKAKQAIDTFFVRAGDLLSAGAVYVGTRVLHLDVAQFAVGNVVMAVLWVGIALLIVRQPSRSRIGAERPAAMIARDGRGTASTGCGAGREATAAA
jgi:AAA family ATP:ADP antiporter